MHAASCGHSLVSIEFNQSLAFYVFHTFSIIFIRYNTLKPSLLLVAWSQSTNKRLKPLGHRIDELGQGMVLRQLEARVQLFFAQPFPTTKGPTVSFFLLVWTFCMARLRRTEVSRRFFLVRSLLSETAACEQGSSHDFLWGWSPEKAPNQAWGSGVSYQS